MAQGPGRVLVIHISAGTPVSTTRNERHVIGPHARAQHITALTTRSSRDFQTCQIYPRIISATIVTFFHGELNVTVPLTGVYNARAYVQHVSRPDAPNHRYTRSVSNVVNVRNTFAACPRALHGQFKRR